MFYVNGERIIMDRGTPFSAGLDIKSSATIIVKPGFNILTTGLSWRRNDKLGPYFGWIKERSGVARKKHCFVMAGIIDNDYVDPIEVLLYNFGPEWTLNSGDRFCQMILMRHLVVPANVLEEMRSGGFGSTGGMSDTGQVKIVNEITTDIKVNNK